MGLFTKIFGDGDKGNDESAVGWKSLTEITQLDELISKSFETPVFIFKHSTRCAISRMALKQFEGHYSIDHKDAEGYFLDLLEYRSVSDAIASKLKVTHQSPQLVLIRNGECSYTVSHSDIDADELKTKLT